MLLWVTGNDIVLILFIPIFVVLSALMLWAWLGSDDGDGDT